MKQILGLDLGVSSIGWALVNEAEDDYEKSSIIRLGARVNPLTSDERKNFSTGKSITTNAERTQKRSMRRSLQRYKLRRNALIDTLKSYGWIDDDTILAESGKNSTFQTLELRAKAADVKISMEELSRVFLIINKKRGYKSSRKLNKVEKEDDGSVIDGMQTAKILQSENLTPGEYSYSLICRGTNDKFLPDFYKSDVEKEFEHIWNFQKQFYPDILTDKLKESLKDKNEKQTWAICQIPFGISGMKRNTKGKELVQQNYEWRSRAIKEKLDLEQLAVVLQKVNAQLKRTDSYLGRISDRSKELYFTNQTIGQYQYKLVQENRHASLKNQVFYRQDYIDEFDRIWETQSRFYPEMTSDKKRIIRDIIIFYQRPLKSQKGLVANCEFEKRRKVCPKSSPVFQEFKVWQILNNLKIDGKYLNIEDKQALFNELNIRNELSKNEVLEFFFQNPRGHDMNYRKIEGNKTCAAIFQAYSKIIEQSGHKKLDFSQKSNIVIDEVAQIFSALGINTDILDFNIYESGKQTENQPLYKLWHLLYSYTEDNSKTGYASLIDKLHDMFGFAPEYCKVLASIVFEDGYGSLSTKAMCKIFQHMKEGVEYSAACAYAGYKHSQRSLTKEEIENKEYNDKLELLPKNSLRNPVVEKILNQMVNVVNGIICKYGKPDEIRVELARELKKSAQERKQMTEAINKAASDNKEIVEILKRDFAMTNVSRNSIIRYKLYMELKENGFHTLYSNTYIPYEDLFSKRFDIEHIIPKSRLFDDSFSNKTLESKDINIEKGDATALDFVSIKYGKEYVDEYKSKIEKIYEKGAISRNKYQKLLMTKDEIPEDFIQRDLRDTQYISRKALEMLGNVVKSVVATSGEITQRLREDWQLVDVLKEINWNKYNKLGLTECYTDPDGHKIKKICNWTKRNDHRHHAMDALTVAFTKRNIIQYFNTLNAGKDESHAISYKGRILPPMPLDEFRSEAKKHLENVLISIKAKNKVVTKNVNKTKKRGGLNQRIQLTPRNQLHNESVYGRIFNYKCKEVKVDSTFNADKIATVACERYRNALYCRLEEYNNDPKKAFGGSNNIEKNPVFTNDLHTECVPIKINTVQLTPVYTIRKQIAADLNVDKVVDRKIKQLLTERLNEYDNDAKKAFANISESPIWLNKEQGIQVKRVTISGPTNVNALHDKHDNFGNLILDENGEKIPSDFVSLSNNHHVAIYVDKEGNLQEQIVPFMEAVARICLGDPVIDKNYNSNEGWKFLFTMKQNEYFVFPNIETGFDPNMLDLTDAGCYSAISPNLYRVQKLATKHYVFRHHLETTVDESKLLRDTTWKRIQNVNGLKGIVKVRIDHLGNIVHVGEY